MRTRAERRVAARYRWDRLRVSFWFAPALMALAAVLLAWAMYWVDNFIPNEALQDSRLIVSGTVGELRSGLLNVAGTVLATAGVVFTLLTLPLSTVASQYGSRLLRLFLGDRTTQLVLGMFVGTFIYCIAAAFSIAPVEVQPDSPQLTASVGFYLMLATFGSLILLVQHISTMLQAPNIAAAGGAELRSAIGSERQGAVLSVIDLKPDPQEPSVVSVVAPDVVEKEGYPIRAKQAGYIQYIDTDIMLTLARDRDLVIRLFRTPGYFVKGGAVVAWVWPAAKVDSSMEREIRHAFLIGNMRTPTQDVEYGIRQLVEMAVRAMSPAINDPYTAMTCLDYIGEGLALFIRQVAPGDPGFYRDARLSCVVEEVSFDSLLSASFDMLRHASCDNASVLLHMLEVIDEIGKATQFPEARQQLLRHVSLIEAESHAGNLIEQDRQAVQRKSDALLMKLELLPGERSQPVGST